MPNWNSVLKEISLIQTTQNESAFDKVRRKYLKELHRYTGRNVIAYYSGFLSKPRIEGIEITDEDKNGFMICIHELKRDRGLDLVLHTPGGDGAATESLVDYLRSMFGLNVRAIIPQISMSAGTMLACSCSTIMLGKQSSLGPVDPQFGPIAAVDLLEEVKRAYAEILANPQAAAFWGHILNKIHPSFLQRCESAIKTSNEFIRKTLAQNMFADLDTKTRENHINKIGGMLSNVKGSKSHSTHFQFEECLAAGLKVIKLDTSKNLAESGVM